ncbi:MAG: ATP-binding protein [Coriobacteriia bacterium]|nr:ATP-binding protein [Coriobacteriia bacterium]
MDRFIDRKEELGFLEDQYKSSSASFIVIYGRRRVGKTTLIQEFAKRKPLIYYLASEESEQQNIKAFKDSIAEFTGDALLGSASVDNWDILFNTLAERLPEQRLVLVIDEFQYLGKANKAFPSILQRAWEMHLKDKNIMLIICGSLISLMEEQALVSSSPLYGRRTGQIRLQQIDFIHYHEFFTGLSYKELIEYYAVTGGVPKYIEQFNGDGSLLAKIEQQILNKRSLLYEEPTFLLSNEVSETGSYFSIIKSIATGNRRIGKISADLGIKLTNLPKYLKTLTDLGLIERVIPVTEKNPEKNKMGLYQITDNFISFWFKFVYPERSRLELNESRHVVQQISDRLIDSHVSFVYESICQGELWQLVNQGLYDINKVGSWWDRQTQIDVVGINNSGNEIIFGECKFQKRLMDIDVFMALLEKKERVIWNRDNRVEKFVLFSISGYTKRLRALAESRDDLLLFERSV